MTEVQGQVFNDCTLVAAKDFPAFGARPGGILHHTGRGSLVVTDSHRIFEVPTRGGQPSVVYSSRDLLVKDVALHPSDANKLVLMHAVSGRQRQLHTLDLAQGHTQLMIDFSGFPLFDDFAAESFALCPASLCGEGAASYIFAGNDGQVKVFRMANPTANHAAGADLVDEFDIASILCRSIGRCNWSPGALRSVRTAGDSIFFLSQAKQELYRMGSSSANAEEFAPQALDRAEVILLPHGPGWRGMDVRADAAGALGAEVVSLGSDTMGIIAEFDLELNRLQRRCQA